MAFLLVGALLIAALLWAANRSRTPAPVAPGDLSTLPGEFVVFDLETTGLSAEKHEIIEIGAIRVRRDAEDHATFSTLVKSKKRVGAKIVQITGIDDEMLAADGRELGEVLPLFRDFIGDLRLVSFNSEFDMAFIQTAVQRHGGQPLSNSVSCALKMARQTWPGRSSYRLAELAKDGGLSMDGTHRALSDARRALIVYSTAVMKLGRVSE